jgi:hypothetical protein
MSCGMSENLVLEHLRAIRADIQALHDGNCEVKARVNEVYSAVLILRRERIDRRLDLRDA